MSYYLQSRCIPWSLCICIHMWNKTSKCVCELSRERGMRVWNSWTLCTCSEFVNTFRVRRCKSAIRLVEITDRTINRKLEGAMEAISAYVHHTLRLKTAIEEDVSAPRIHFNYSYFRSTIMYVVHVPNIV